MRFCIYTDPVYVDRFIQVFGSDPGVQSADFTMAWSMPDLTTPLVPHYAVRSPGECAYHCQNMAGCDGFYIVPETMYMCQLLASYL